MERKRIFEVMRNIILNSSYKPAEFMDVAHCVAYLDEQIKSLEPVAVPEEPKGE